MTTLTFAIVGSGGSGVVSLGEMILRAAAKTGYFGLMRKSFGPQIRGGESAAIIRLGAKPVRNFNTDLHALFALDWLNFSRFEDDIPLHDHTVIFADSNTGSVPLGIEGVIELNLTGAAKAVGASRANSVLLGFLGAWLGCSQTVLAEVLQQRLANLESGLQSLSIAAMEQGFALWNSHNTLTPSLVEVRQGNLVAPLPDARWIASGNQLAGLGMLEGGVRFVAAYPITPASDCLEWIAQNIESVAGHLVQAEDELAAINMVIGAAYGGVPAMTATSGPGLALMTEAMGLAVASETPVVVLNVMRGGPSTGIPTKSEQSDLNLALYGLHGDAPHVVMAALGIEDCHNTGKQAVNIAWQLQTLAIVLSDQFMGQSLQVLEALPTLGQPKTKKPEIGSLPYQRYSDTNSGISPMATPGTPDCMYTADGLEHNENAVPSANASDHARQLAKRQRKLQQLDMKNCWGETHGEGDIVIVCFGSIYATALEAQRQLAAKNIAVKVIGLRLLQPFPKDLLSVACGSAHTVLVVEQNQQGQLFRYMQSLGIFNVQSFARPGPILISPEEIATLVSKPAEVQ